MNFLSRISQAVQVLKTGPAGISVPGAPFTDMPAPRPMMEIGVSGLLRTKGVGYVYEEWLRDLSTARAKQIYREMRDNDAVLGAIFFALEMILRKAEWRVDAASTKAEHRKTQEFVEQCMDDMSHTWPDFIAECVSMFPFGFALFETVYKRRQGPDGRTASRYDDGLIGWRKFAPRAQESILYWRWDEEGGLQGAVQLAAPDYHSVPMPIQKLLLFRTTTLKNNPEGRSVLRNCYRSWFLKRRIEEIEAIGIERDLCGLPVMRVDAETQAKYPANFFENLVTNIRRDDQMGVVLPSAYDDKGNQLITLELIKSGGQTQMKASDTIRRYNSDMLNTMLAGFIEVGQGDVGSWALASSKTRIFSIAIGAFMDSIAAVINRIAIPRLLALNKIPQDYAPQLVPGDIEVRDLEELGAYVQRLAQSGIMLGDKPTADFLRKQAKMPEEPEMEPATRPAPKPGAPTEDDEARQRLEDAA